MHALRLALVTLMCWSFAGFMLHHVLSGLRLGKIAYSRTNQWCYRSRTPIGFWVLVTLFLGFAAAAMYAWWQVVSQ